jgi:hypothetical protein
MTDPQALDTRVLERRIDGVRAVRQVLKAVWALARAELARADAAAEEAVFYGEWADDLVDRLLVPAQGDAPPTFRVIIGPERPFAGALPRLYIDHLHAPGPLGIVGRRLDEVAREIAEVRSRVRFLLPGATSPGDAEECAARIAAAVLAHGADERVSLVHPFGARGTLVTRALLSGTRSVRSDPPEILSPLPEVVDAALRAMVTGRLAVALLETLRAEVHARIEMADAARRTCDRRLDELTDAWCVARQTQITSEIVEVVAAGLALAKD